MITPTKTRVLHLINGEFYAGAERVQDLLAIQLGRFGFEVEFACLKDGIFPDKRYSKASILHAFPMRSRLDLALCNRLAQLVRSRGCRLIHTHTSRNALIGYLVAKLSRVPMVRHVHSPSEKDTEDDWRNVRNSLVDKISMRGASKLITVSENLEQRMRSRGFASGRICRVPNGVPVSACSRLSYVPGDELVIGMVALYRPRKGVEVLLDAMSQLHAAGVPIRLHAVGPFETPEYEDSVRELACKLGLEQWITWIGFTSDTHVEFGRMHVFVLPSTFGEGMPMVVLEAMAAGLPVVSTRVGGIPEIVRHGEDGLLVDPCDSEALANALLKFTRGEVAAQLMGDNGRQRQRVSFSDVAMAEGVAAVYREVLRA